VELVSSIIGYTGEIYWNVDKPDGTPRKLLDVSRLGDLGWKSKIGLSEGIMSVYGQYCINEGKVY